MSTLAALIAGPALAAAVAMPFGPSEGTPQSTEALAAVMPRYDDDRALLLPGNHREWVFVGSSLGLSYDAAGTDHEMFHETLMEPTAYRHFVETGEFREGTMFVLLLHGVESGVLPGRRGQFAGELHGVEMAVKDNKRVEGGWAYYGFGGMGGATTRTAQPEAGGSCASCHKTHGARDNVFLQFYPLLAGAAGVKVPLQRAGASPGRGGPD